MPQSEKYKALNIVDRVSTLPGANIEDDTLSVVLVDENSVSIDGQTVDSLVVTDDGDFNIVDSDGDIIEEPLDVSSSAIEIGTWSAGSIGVEDSEGTQIDPDLSPEYPDDQTTEHDLIDDGDLTIGPVPVQRAGELVISANSTDDNEFSVSIDWVDDDGNIFQSESETDIEMESITQDWSRLVRKGPRAEVTITDESGGDSNRVNVHIDTQR